MALIVADRVMEASTSTGTGNFALAGAYTGYRDFDSVCANNDTVYYCIEALDANGNPSGAWETGLGTFTDTDTLVRTTPQASSNAGAAVNFAAGNKRVTLDATATFVAPVKNLSGTNTGDQAGALIGRQVITATGAGTYTPTSGTNSIVIELIGGGGGGGAVAQPTGSNGGTGSGGGAGGYVSKRLTAAFSGAGYSVGVKGTGGLAGANAGNAGGDTTFTATGGGTVYTAAGGNGGPAGGAAAVPQRSSTATGGAGTNGDINISGGAAVRNFIISTSLGLGGVGGSGRFSNAAAASAITAVNTSAAGAAATGKGGGGGGAVAVGTGAAAAGGDGSDGMIIIWEYS